MCSFGLSGKHVTEVGIEVMFRKRRKKTNEVRKKKEKVNNFERQDLGVKGGQ